MSPKKLVFIYPNEISCIEYSCPNSNLKEFFDNLFQQELEAYLTIFTSSSSNRFKELDDLEEKLLVTKIFNETQVLPLYSQGYLQSCWFSENDSQLKVSLDTYEVYELEDWFEKNKIG